MIRKRFYMDRIGGQRNSNNRNSKKFRVRVTGKRRWVRILFYVCAGVLFASCDSRKRYGTDRNDDNLIVKSQVDELRHRLDSLIQSLRPQPKRAPGKVKLKGSGVASHKLQQDSLPSADSRRSYNSVQVPEVKRENDNAAYRVRTGAICNDGTRSYATGRGACSHHGGVREWLYQ